MNTPDLQKLRRFALATAIIVAAYGIAGVEIDPDRPIALLGLPLRLTKPYLLPIVLAATAVFSAGRFWFYGFVLLSSPAATRKRFLEHVRQTRAGPQADSPFVVRFRDEQEGYEYFEKMRAAFPKLGSQEIVIKTPSIAMATNYVEFDVTELRVPLAIRLAGRVHDLDYSSPVWTNAVALFLLGQSLFSKA